MGIKSNIQTIIRITGGLTFLPIVYDISPMFILVSRRQKRPTNSAISDENSTQMASKLLLCQDNDKCYDCINKSPPHLRRFTAK